MTLVSKEFDLTCGQFRTHLMEAGRDDGPCLFLIHDGGLGGDLCSSWDQLIPELRDDFHIYAIDLYGFGKSSKVFEFGRRPYESHIEQVAHVVNELGIGKAIFVGTSYGGSLVLRAASQHPSPWPMLGGISIAGTGGVYRHEAGKQLLADIEPTRESLERFVHILARPDWPGSASCTDERLRNALEPGHWEALAAPRLRRAGADASGREVDEYPKSLSRCRVPLLLIEGSQDELLEDDWAARLASNAPFGKSAKLPSRHSPNLDCAPEIARLLREFERSLRQSASGQD